MPPSGLFPSNPLWDPTRTDAPTKMTPTVAARDPHSAHAGASKHHSNIPPIFLSLINDKNGGNNFTLPCNPAPHWHPQGHERRWVGYLSEVLATLLAPACAECESRGLP